MKTATTKGVCHMQTAHAIKDYLRGFGRVDARALKELKSVSNNEWKKLALGEFMNRMTRILHSLTDQQLMLLSIGEIQMQELIAQVSDES